MKHTHSRLTLAFACLFSVMVAGCGDNSADKQAQDAKVEIDSNPYPSTYKPISGEATVITNVTILDGVGKRIDNGMVYFADGKIAAVGETVEYPEGTQVIDGQGKWVTPGIIDNHSHLGVYPSPSVGSTSDGNEMVKPVTPGVWAEHSVWAQDSGFGRALAGGVTALQILPGSGNLIGGRSVVLKNVPNRTMQDMKFPDAPYGMKMACGENPKRVYGDKGGPMTRMGNVRGYRQAWADAQDYLRQWERYDKEYADGKNPKAPKRDLDLETLAGVLKGDILVHMHCYRADEMTTMIDLMQEFDYKIASFHHAVEAYKIADKLKENNICAALWADWWGFKLEAYDGIRENIPLVHTAGACAIVHSDDELGIQRLNQEAAKAWSDGKRAGMNIPMEDAWTWLSANPAKSLGIFDKTGSLETGKNADLVLWNGNPFSTYTKAERVYIDGGLAYSLDDKMSWPVSDFELGQVGEGDAK
ncbi:amidohydrolase family protein [Alteromonas pelagimontana]|uniref:Amidohydrolase family protein n=1 Tax=Alteromonas pelagimontana TaxID=1858656 RepID=A0A6M4MAW7_9ALTE|nr:amidohydrolase [Alteromonas pelagimontana]QJR79780.1 amidohydrolase family protein [Alteromonas pelagimontana]